MGDSARTNTHRCIWLTREQRDNIARMYGALADPPGTPLRDAIDAWDAAPANPTEAVGQAIATILRERPYCAPEHVVEAVLRALGHPDA